MSDLISATAADFRSALEEFEAAWENPNHTRFTLPAVQVNSVLAEKYTTSSPIRLTRHMVWDMEQQKRGIRRPSFLMLYLKANPGAVTDCAMAANAFSGPPSN
jgi:hypothetical protein